VFAITTEGEASGREDSILGQLVDENEAQGDLEQMPGATISRDHDSRTVVFRFHAVESARCGSAAVAEGAGGRESGS
jgi:hypothetical protein